MTKKTFKKLGDNLWGQDLTTSQGKRIIIINKDKTMDNEMNFHEQEMKRQALQDLYALALKTMHYPRAEVIAVIDEARESDLTDEQKKDRAKWKTAFQMTGSKKEFETLMRDCGHSDEEIDANYWKLNDEN